MIYLYAAVDDGLAAGRALTSTAPRETVGGRLCVVEAGGIPCLLEIDATRPPGRDGPDGLMAHDRVVSALVDTCAVVPFRFGTVFESRPALQRCVAGRAGRIRDLFEVVAGRRELALRARRRRPGSDCGRMTGRQYLRSLSRRVPEGPLDTLHRAMATSSVAACAEGDGEGGIKAAYLVDVDGIDRFCARLADEQARIGGVEVSLTGPWAAYSFVQVQRP